MLRLLYLMKRLRDNRFAFFAGESVPKVEAPREELGGKIDVPEKNLTPEQIDTVLAAVKNNISEVSDYYSMLTDKKMPANIRQKINILQQRAKILEDLRNRPFYHKRVLTAIARSFQELAAHAKEVNKQFAKSSEYDPLAGLAEISINLLAFTKPEPAAAPAAPEKQAEAPTATYHGAINAIITNAEVTDAHVNAVLAKFKGEDKLRDFDLDKNVAVIIHKSTDGKAIRVQLFNKSPEGEGAAWKGDAFFEDVYPQSEKEKAAFQEKTENQKVLEARDANQKAIGEGLVALKNAPVGTLLLLNGKFDETDGVTGNCIRKNADGTYSLVPIEQKPGEKTYRVVRETARRFDLDKDAQQLMAFGIENSVVLTMKGKELVDTEVDRYLKEQATALVAVLPLGPNSDLANTCKKNVAAILAQHPGAKFNGDIDSPYGTYKVNISPQRIAMDEKSPKKGEKAKAYAYNITPGPALKPDERVA